MLQTRRSGIEMAPLNLHFIQQFCDPRNLVNHSYCTAANPSSNMVEIMASAK
jgi:hypothetical protein